MATMTIHAPFEITPRLLPGTRIGGAWVALKFVGCAGGRMVYRWYVDLADGREFSEADLKSGMQGATYQQMFGTLFSFLGAFAESCRYRDSRGGEPENCDLFPAELEDWARENSDEFACLGMMAEEGDTVFIEE